jgi:Cd2+/Zn2+-exporting ATPase
VLFKGGAAIEQLAAVRRIAFDKTGTLTAGRPAVTAVVPFGGHSPEEVLALAAAVERGASHPIADAIVAAAHARGLPKSADAQAAAIPGKGARAEIDGWTVLAGSPRLFGAAAAPYRAEIEASERAGQTVVLVGTETALAGMIALADPVRPASRQTVAALHALGLRCAMLTGDNAATARRIAEAVGVDDVRAELLPEDKVAAVRALQADGPVAMIGDGINDAPALATAEVGIAMGAGGADVALEAADVALIGDDLAQLPAAVRLARRTMAIIRQNIAAALVVKAAFLLLTILGVTNLWLAVLADTGMSLLVTGNSLRLLRHAARSVPAAHHAPHGHAEPGHAH